MVHRIVAATALVLSLAIAGCSSSGDIGTPVATSPNQIGAGTTQFPVGQRPHVPTLSGDTISGSSLDTSTMAGQVVVLNAWASWCEPCREESPALARISKRVSSLGIDFVGLDEEDTKDKAMAFATKMGTTYPHLFDEHGDLLASLRLLPTSGIPSTLVLDRQGNVAARVIGAIHEQEFEALLRSVASEPAPTASS